MIKINMISLLIVVNLFGISNFEVIKKNDQIMSGFEDSKSLITMTLVNAKGKTRIRTMKYKSLEQEGGDKSLMEFLSPADVKGAKFLNYEYAKKDDHQWLYLPALQRVKRISSKNKSGAFMGSEFSYEDVSSFNINKYDYKKEEVLVSKINGKNVYMVECYPNYKYSGYTKQIFHIDAKTFLIIQVDYYDRKKFLLKSAFFSNYKLINGLYRNGTIHVKNFQNFKESILVWEEESIKNGLTSKDFHKKVLKR